MTKETTYKPNETYNILKSLVEANDAIMKAGGVPVSVSLVGTPGLGKTTICRELARDLNRDFFKLNLAQLTEPSELIGYYSKEYGVKKGEDIKCNTLFSQAVMELVNEQTMVGWDLKKKGIQIILTENPDNGEYNVASMDKAQTDRMMRINMVWDAKDWAERAEKIGLDERLINFVLWKPETFENKKQDGISASNQVTPRMMDKFFSLVSTIDDFEKNLDRILLFGDISVGKNITSELINFINKKLDKLPSVEKLIKEYNLDTAKAQLTQCCGDYEKDANNWKGATSAILCTRLYNYMRHHSGKLTKDNIKQYLELILHGAFSVDQKFLMVRQTIGANNNLTSILASDPRFIKYMTK